MTKIAILGDVRANEPALLAVLARIAQLQVDRLWHVGSLLSYGPDPIAVSDYFRTSPDAERCLLGHPDTSILTVNGLSHFNAHALRTFTRVQRVLRPRWWSGSSTRRRWIWLNTRPTQGSDVGIQLFSGTPLQPDADVLPVISITGRQERLEPHFAQVSQGAFVGTLGRPGIAFSNTIEWQDITAYDQPVPLNGRRFIACPGSVGQPRDRDPRACFTVFDGESITWHRVPYDISETRRRILAQPDIDERYADRLEVGR